MISETNNSRVKKAKRTRAARDRAVALRAARVVLRQHVTLFPIMTVAACLANVCSLLKLFAVALSALMKPLVRRCSTFD